MTDTSNYLSDDIGIPNGAPVWMDLVTDDPDKAVAFYKELFGWKANEAPPEFGGYRYFTYNDQGVGGCMKNDADFDMPNVWQIFLRTGDSRATEQAVTSNGGEILMPTMDVADNGSFTIFKDAGGAVASAWQPKNERGFGVLGEMNTPAHFELHTRDHEKTVAFYENAFGWKTTTNEVAPGLNYTLLGTNEVNRAGIMDASQWLPDSVPAHWSVYIRVADADAIVAKAQQLGGTLMQGIDDTPFGRLATLTDSTGTVFKIMG